MSLIWMPLTRVLTLGSLTSDLSSSTNCMKPGRATRLTGMISVTMSLAQLSTVEASCVCWFVDFGCLLKMGVHWPPPCWNWLLAGAGSSCPHDAGLYPALPCGIFPHGGEGSRLTFLYRQFPSPCCSRIQVCISSLPEKDE